MTIALCLSCGETKWGALCPCRKCGVASTGDTNLDIAFSDHNIAPKTLEELGGVIRVIHQRADDPAIRFWTFIQYISNIPDSILHAQTPDEYKLGVDAVMALGPLPAVELKPSPAIAARAAMAERSFEIQISRARLEKFLRALGAEPMMAPRSWRIDVQLADGSVAEDILFTTLIDQGFVSREDKKYEFSDEQIKAIRQRFSLLHPFRSRRWISVADE